MIEALNTQYFYWRSPPPPVSDVSPLLLLCFINQSPSRILEGPLGCGEDEEDKEEEDRKRKRGRRAGFFTLIQDESVRAGPGSGPGSHRLCGPVSVPGGPAAQPDQRPSAGTQRLRHAAAQRHQQEILHQLQTVVPPQGLRETHVSLWKHIVLLFVTVQPAAGGMSLSRGALTSYITPEEEQSSGWQSHQCQFTSESQNLLRGSSRGRVRLPLLSVFNATSGGNGVQTL
ncbi:uncharacterized protein LOC118333400 [Morone saxatilis]|uniref:uncharacterized protein LOC118333400 n=1 Tax=Morone saxatilis TaxID=34816 RepID=UPI0015E1FCD6|nr:uncharacterized protein LOC118333400 [Morone saxatilis]